MWAVRHRGGIAAIGGQRRIAALLQPRRQLRRVAQRLDHHGVVIALQRDEAPAAADARQQPFDDLPALRPLVDIVADRDDDAGFAARMRGDLAKRAAEQIVAAVNVAE